MKQMLLAETGCAVPQIAAITGHGPKSVTQTLEQHLAPAQHLAEAEITRFQNGKAPALASRLQTGARKGQGANSK